MEKTQSSHHLTVDTQVNKASCTLVGQAAVALATAGWGAAVLEALDWGAAASETAGWAGWAAESRGRNQQRCTRLRGWRCCTWPAPSR